MASEDTQQPDWTAEQLAALDHAELVNLWRATWPHSQSKFANEYGIDKGNFSRWLLGKKESNISVTAVVHFLSKPIAISSNSTGPTDPLESSSKVVFSSIDDKRQLFRSKIKSLKQLCEIIQS